MMNPMNLIPSPDRLPAPPFLFHLLEMIFFLVHIILVNIILGFSIVLGARIVRDARPDTPLDPGFISLGEKLPTVIAFTINMGIPVLLFVQVLWGQFFYTGSILMAWFWILIIPVLLAVYYSAYANGHRISRLGTRDPLVILQVSGLVIISLIFTCNITFMLQPGLWTAYFSHPAGILLPLSDISLFPRWFHYIAASIAMAGLVLALAGHFRVKRGLPEAGIVEGLRIYIIATLCQAAVGVIFLLSLPTGFTLAFLGGKPFYTVVLACGILTSLLSIITAMKKLPVPTASLLMVTMVMMVITRDNLRTLYLNPWFQTSSLPVTLRIVPLVLFVLTLCGGIGIILWMLRYARVEGEGRLS